MRKLVIVLIVIQTANGFRNPTKLIIILIIPKATPIIKSNQQSRGSMRRTKKLWSKSNQNNWVFKLYNVHVRYFKSLIRFLMTIEFSHYILYINIWTIKLYNDLCWISSSGFHLVSREIPSIESQTRFLK